MKEIGLRRGDFEKIVASRLTRAAVRRAYKEEVQEAQEFENNMLKELEDIDLMQQMRNEDQRRICMSITSREQTRKAEIWKSIKQLGFYMRDVRANAKRELLGQNDEIPFFE